jgi:hypothetical protein
VVEDENGNIVRETMKDNDVLAQYKVGRGCGAEPQLQLFLMTAPTQCHMCCMSFVEVSSTG